MEKKTKASADREREAHRCVLTLNFFYFVIPLFLTYSDEHFCSAHSLSGKDSDFRLLVKINCQMLLINASKTLQIVERLRT